MSGLTLVTPPTNWPVTLKQATDWLRVEVGVDNEIIQALIYAATGACENYTKRALYRQKWRLTFDNEFPEKICFPLPPTISVDSITYVAADGTTATLSSALYRVASGVITPIYGGVWPTTQPLIDAVTVDFFAGYTSATSDGDPTALIPAAFKTAMQLFIAHWYENPQAVITGTIAAELPLGAKFLLNPYRVVRV